MKNVKEIEKMLKKLNKNFISIIKKLKININIYFIHKLFIINAKLKKIFYLYFYYFIIKISAFLVKWKIIKDIKLAALIIEEDNLLRILQIVQY